MKVSFDFDDTLDAARIKSIAKECIKRGYDVSIVTARPHETLVKFGGEDWNDDLYEVANDLGIDANNIHFMNLKPKYKFFQKNKFDWHLDDCVDEWKEINENTDTRCYKLYDEFDEFLLMMNKC